MYRELVTLDEALTELGAKIMLEVMGSLVYRIKAKWDEVPNKKPGNVGNTMSTYTLAEGKHINEELYVEAEVDIVNKGFKFIKLILYTNDENIDFILDEINNLKHKAEKEKTTFYYEQIT